MSSLTYLNQGVTMFLAWVFLGETLSVVQMVGLTVVTCAVFIIHSAQPYALAFYKIDPKNNGGIPTGNQRHKTGVTGSLYRASLVALAFQLY